MNNFGLLVVSAITVSSFVTLAQAQPELPDTEKGAPAAEDAIDLQAMTCREFLKTDSEESENIAIFLHGYMSGVAGARTVNGPELAIASDRIVDDCIDNPEAALFSTFEANR